MGRKKQSRRDQENGNVQSRARRHSLQCSAFTLIELLVVIAIIAILAALIAPTLARAKSYGKRTACVANYRQLQLAWQMYIDDYGRLPRNKIDYLAGTFPDSPNWVAGTLQIMDGWADNTNTVQMVNAFGGIGVYLKTPKVYKCPEDRSIATFGPRRHPRARSVAMNNWMGLPSQLSTSDVRWYATVSDLLAGLPVENGFVFIDTHPDSIATGMFVKALDGEFWDQFPSSLHNGAATLSFTDGHVITHKWRDPRTRAPVRGQLLYGVKQVGNPDHKWLLDRATAPRKASPW